MRHKINILFVSIISFSLSYAYWIHNNQAEKYLSLTELPKPFVYRQLAPMLARSLTWFGMSENWAIIIISTLAGVCFYFALRALILQFYQADELYIFALWTLGISLFWLERLPSDWLTACLFSLALLLLAQNKLLGYCLLFSIICLNRETAFLLTIFYLFYDHDIHMGRDIAIMLYQVFVWFGVRLGLMWIFRNNSGSDFWFRPIQNFQIFFAHPWHSLFHIVITGVILYFIFKDWKIKPEFLRLAFVIFAPIFLVAYWVFGEPYEVRVMIEIYPVIALLMLPSLVTNKMYYAIFKGSRYVAMAKKEPFSSDNPNPIYEPGELWFEFGDTREQAMNKLKESLYNK